MMERNKIKVSYVEDRDCGASLELPEYNKLTIKSESNGLENYLVLSTKRWALDEESISALFIELNKLLKEANAGKT